MIRRLKLAILLGVCFGVLVTIAASAAENSTGPSAVGKWRLDLAKSSFSNNPPTFEQLVVFTDDVNAVKWMMTGSEGHGVTYTSSYDGPVDGKDHPMKSSESKTMIAYTRTGGGLHWIAKNSDGAVIETATRSISPDGKTMTIKGTGKYPNGEIKFVSVFGKAN
ncbi:MAG: hypothetical protein WA655_02505 [Candidatus Korobacteraceae bacterium]